MINQSYNQHVIYMAQMESKKKWFQWRNNVTACQTQGQGLKTGELKYVCTRVMVSYNIDPSLNTSSVVCNLL